MEIFLVIFVIGLAFSLWIFLVWWAEDAKMKAQMAYQDHLKALQDDPSNPNLRMRTLELGRIYSNMTRNKKGVTLFDEVALMNDINAACAGANRNRNRNNTPSVEPSLEERLERLKRLRDSNHITEEEYQRKKEQILDRLEW